MFKHEEEGYVEPPSGPGPGIELDKVAIRKHIDIGISYERPTRRHYDGSIVEQ